MQRIVMIKHLVMSALVKDIVSVLDDGPILRYPQLKLWQWISEYYLCATGDVYKAAVPAGLKIESETFIELNPDYEESPFRLLLLSESIRAMSSFSCLGAPFTASNAACMAVSSLRSTASRRHVSFFER